MNSSFSRTLKPRKKKSPSRIFGILSFRHSYLGTFSSKTFKPCPVENLNLYFKKSNFQKNRNVYKQPDIFLKCLRKMSVIINLPSWRSVKYSCYCSAYEHFYSRSFDFFRVFCLYNFDFIEKSFKQSARKYDSLDSCEIRALSRGALIVFAYREDKQTKNDTHTSLTLVVRPTASSLGSEPNTTDLADPKQWPTRRATLDILKKKTKKTKKSTKSLVTQLGVELINQLNYSRAYTTTTCTQ